MAEVKSLVCDVCGIQAVGTWQVGPKGRKPVVVDVCSTHAAVLEDLLTRGRSGEGSHRPYRTIKKVDAVPL